MLLIHPQLSPITAIKLCSCFLKNDALRLLNEESQTEMQLVGYS
jgi:hypothetical protein